MADSTHYKTISLLEMTSKDITDHIHSKYLHYNCQPCIHHHRVNYQSVKTSDNVIIMNYVFMTFTNYFHYDNHCELHSNSSRFLYYPVVDNCSLLPRVGVAQRGSVVVRVRIFVCVCA